MERLTLLPYPRRVGNKGLITQKRKFDVHSHAQFSRYKVETSQVRQILQGTGRGEVYDSTVPPEEGGSRIKG